MVVVNERTKRRRRSYRYFLPAFAVGYYARKNFYTKLLPFGPAEKVPPEQRHTFSPVDFDNDSLRLKHGKLKKIYERVEENEEPLMKGPETVVVDPDNGNIYALTEDARIVKLDDFQSVDEYTITARTTFIVDVGVGRPLGGSIINGDIYIADSLLGLTRVQNFDSSSSSKKKTKKQQPSFPKVELLASRVKLEDGNWSQILYADDVDVGRKSGMVYFSDASDVPPDRIETKTWDIMYASKVEYARGKPTGRLLRYDPNTHEVTVLASGIWFANGIGVDPDERFVMISETMAGRTLKYHLEGPQKGTLTVMADEFPGYPDGATCFTRKTCFAPIVLAEDPFMHFIFKLPHPVDAFLRTLLMMLPKSLAPEAKPFGGLVEMTTAEDGTVSTRIIQDPNGQDIAIITGVTHYDGKLYLGSHTKDFIGLYDLN